MPSRRLHRQTMSTSERHQGSEFQHGGRYVTGTASFSDQKPLVSGLIFCRNGGGTLEKSILSILNQDYENIEIIIADGASTDNTVDILKEYNHKIHYWRSEPDKAASEAQNKALSWSRGDYFFFVNADDWIDPSYVSNALSLIEGKDIDFLIGDVSLYRDGKLDKVVCGKSNYRDQIYRHHSIPTPSVFYRRSFYERCGEVDCRYKTASDYEWFLRATARGLKGHYDPSLHVHMVFGGRSAPTEWREALKLFWRAEERQIQILYGVPAWRATWNVCSENMRNLVSRCLVSLGLSSLRGMIPQRWRR